MVGLDRVDKKVHTIERGRSPGHIFVARSNTSLRATLGVRIPSTTTCTLATKGDIDDLVYVSLVQCTLYVGLTIFIFFQEFLMSQFCGTKFSTGMLHLLGSGLSLLMSAGMSERAKYQTLMPSASTCVAHTPPPFLLKVSPKVP